MAYSKRHFKQSKKLDNAMNFIKQHNYQRAIETIGQYQNESTYGRYLAGYSLMKLDRKPEAFSVWWPLFKAGSDAFKTDCQLLLQEVFSEPVWQVVQWRNLQPKILADLLSAALYFSIETTSTRELEQYLIETLWNERQWELLSGILNIERTESYASLVLKAQLAFAAPRNSGLKPVPFAGLLMSAGASYLAVTPNPGDIAESGHLLKALANEIYNVYPVQQNGTRTAEQERMSLRLFLDLEWKTLEKILSLNPARQMPYILSPGYFYHNDIPENYRSSIFDCLRKCGAETEVVDMYRREVFSNYMNVIRGGADFPKRISGLLCFEPSLPHVTSSLSLPCPPTSLLAQFSAMIYRRAIVCSKSIEVGEEMIPEKAIQELAKFSQAIGDGILAKVAVFWALKNASLRIAKDLPWVESLVDISKVFKGAEVSKQINEVLDQRNHCALFLGTLAAKRTARALELSAIVDNVHAFRVHFAIVANTQVLLPPHKTAGPGKGKGKGRKSISGAEFGSIPWEKSMAVPYMRHVYALIEKSARLDLNLDNAREAAKNCKCDDCQMELYRSIPDLAKQTGCPAPGIQVDEPQYLHDIQSELAENWMGSVFDQENPFKTLNVSPTDSKQAVLAALMSLMRANPADMARLRQAQDRAFDPSVRFLHGLLNCPEHPSLIGEFEDQKKGGLVAHCEGPPHSDRRTVIPIELRPKDMIL